MKLSHQIHEWLADRVSWVQYPNIRPADQSTRNASKSWRFEYSMPIGKRLDLFIMSSGLLLIGLIAASLVGLFIYLLL